MFYFGIHVFYKYLGFGIQCFVMQMLVLVIWNFQCFATDLGFLEMCISSEFAGNAGYLDVDILVFYCLFA